MRARVLVLLLMAAGCGGDDSGEDEGGSEVEEFPDLEGFPYYVDFRVWQYEDGYAELWACLYRYQLCEQAGTVQVEHAGETVTLTDDPDAFNQSHVGELDGITVDEPFRFTWSGSGDQSEVTGEVFMADPFTISAPGTGSTLSAGSPLAMDWTAGSSEGLMAWGYSGTCDDSSFDRFYQLIPDSGHVDIPVGKFPLYDGCLAVLWLERLQRGTTNSAEAEILSSQARAVEVTIGP